MSRGKRTAPVTGYRARLARRGLRRAPAMLDVDTLRALHHRRERESGEPWPTWAEMRQASIDAREAANNGT